jgi:NAD(P)-dependent dehydrogenase (short-subunit alcohol dehydrogenase family)
MELELQQQVFIITGGTDGLGASLAHRLVGEGARVAVCGRDETRVTETERSLSATGGDGIGIVCDVTSPADIEALVGATVDRWGRLDGVVNNAGQAAGGQFDEATDETWQYDHDLKVMAAVRLTRLALPHLRSGGGGAVVNVLNTGAKAPGARSLPTTASRAAGLAITKALSKELGPDGIRVNAVLVGLVDSGQWRRRSEQSGRSLDEIYAEMASHIPLGRVGRSDEFADLAAFLLSARSSYVTGSAINLDGGSSPVL